MKLHSPNTLVLVLVVLGLVILTGAVITEDRVWDKPKVVLTPHDGPNGEQYAELGSEGNLSIDLETVGVNPNALTSIRDIFDVTNNGDERVRVWITHSAADSVRFTVAANGSIQGEENNVTLGSGESRVVSMLIDTNGVGPSDEPLLTAFEFHVAPAAEEPTTPTPTPTSTPTPSGGAVTPAPEPTPEPTSTPTPVPDTRVEDVEVVLDEPGDERVSVRDVPVEEVLEAETDDDDAREPLAVIDIDRGVDTDGERAARPPPDIGARGAQAVVEVNEEVTLSGAQSIVGSVRSVDRERRLVKAADIDPPEGHEDEPATIRMRVNAERFEGTDLTRPRIGRQTADGWQMLPTRVLREEGDQLVLEARTPGFSRFAVFATPDVRYTWKLGNETVTAEELRTRFDEPGFHNVSLTVIDAFGRSSTATFRVLVNDRPKVSIDVPANRTAGEPFRLRANVTDVVGNTTVTWTFPDGSQQTGLVARRTFERGEHTVLVTVEDEYGARTTVEQTVAIGPLAEAELTIERIAGGLSVELAIGLVSLLSFLLAARLRPALARGGLGGLGVPSLSAPIPSVGRFPLRRRAPRIVALDDPVVDVRNRRFRIGHLRIEDPDGDLATVEIAVIDARGNEVALKTVDLQGRAEYVVRNGAVMPKSRVYVREDEEYIVRVRAGDRHDRWTGLSRSRVGSSTTSGAPG